MEAGTQVGGAGFRAEQASMKTRGISAVTGRSSTCPRGKLTVIMPTKKELLKAPIRHIDIAQYNVVPLVDAMAQMAYSSRDTARAASIYEMMLRDRDCGVILCLAGSLISAGLQKVYVDMIA